jgi:hypothetical protein
MSAIIGAAHDLGVEPAKIRKFYEANWPRRIALSDSTFYTWQFLGQPRKGGQDSCHVAIDEHTRELIGVMGLNERPFNLKEREVRGAELTTWIVEAKYQGSGVGAKILLNLQETYEVLLGMNISEMALPIYLRTGFKFIRHIPRYFRVYNSERVEKFAEISPLSRKLIHLWKQQEEIKYCATSPEDSDLKYVDTVMKKRFHYFSRDTEYLTWRYLAHPYFKYELKVIECPNNIGKKMLIVYRIEETTAGFRILHILDLVGDLEIMPAAISYVNFSAESHNVDLADFYCTLQPILDYFLPRGWFSTVDDQHIKVPNLFQPIELRDPQTSSMIFWGNHSALDIFNKSNLYVTKQDCDLDRPTGLFIDENKGNV